MYGFDGTAKTGAAMELRTEDDIMTGRPLYILDFDKSAKPIKSSFHNNDPNIIILDPTVRYKEGETRGELNATATIAKTMSILFYIEEQGPEKQQE